MAGVWYKGRHANPSKHLEPRRSRIVAIVEKHPEVLASVKISPPGRGFVVFLQDGVATEKIPRGIKGAITRRGGIYPIVYMSGGKTGAKYIPMLTKRIL
jgi:hypothetical protein